MKAKTRFILDECVERGIRGGLLNTDGLSFDIERFDFILDSFTQRVMNEIDDYFTFED